MALVIKQTNTPNQGDFTFTVPAVENESIVGNGNVNTGIFQIANGVNRLKFYGGVFTKTTYGGVFEDTDGKYTTTGTVVFQKR